MGQMFLHRLNASSLMMRTPSGMTKLPSSSMQDNPSSPPANTQEPAMRGYGLEIHSNEAPGSPNRTHVHQGVSPKHANTSRDCQKNTRDQNSLSPGSKRPKSLSRSNSTCKRSKFTGRKARINSPRPMFLPPAGPPRPAAQRRRQELQAP